MWPILEWLFILFVITQVGIPALYPPLQYFWIFRKSTKAMVAAEDRIRAVKEEEAVVDLNMKATELRDNLNKKRESSNV